MIKGAEDKNAALLPERIDGKWILFHRPSHEAGGGSSGEIALSRSDDLGAGAVPEQVLAAARGRLVGLAPSGIGPPPLAHRPRLADRLSRRQGNRRRRHVPGRSRAARPRRAGRVRTGYPEWIFGPQAPYEREGESATPCSRAGSSTTGRGTVAAVLRRGGHLDRPCDGTTRRTARRVARRSGLTMRLGPWTN